MSGHSKVYYYDWRGKMFILHYINSKSHPAKPFGQNCCTNEYMYIFRMQWTWRTNIWIYSECQKMPTEYLNIIRGLKRDEYLRIWTYLSQNIRMSEYSLHTALVYHECLNRVKWSLQTSLSLLFSHRWYYLYRHICQLTE